MRLLGWDAAVDSSRLRPLASPSRGGNGIAVGTVEGTRLVVEEVLVGLSEVGLHGLLCRVTREESPVLLSIDAPLGWPEAMGRGLVGHVAGGMVGIDADQMFRRETDRFVLFGTSP